MLIDCKGCSNKFFTMNYSPVIIEPQPTLEEMQAHTLLNIEKLLLQKEIGI